ncbi:MAG: phage major capsid protein, partial [Actinomycetota bacterium]|nr:phage major capsid protein [Actinomycetota bacterium]
PTPGKEAYLDALVAIRYHAYGFEITDQTTKQAKGNEGAFVNILDDNTTRLAKNMRKNINRQVYGDGTGLLASLTAASAGTATVTVDTTQYLQVGDPVDILNRTSGAVVSVGRTIVSINRTTKVVTLDAAVTAANTDGLYLSGSRSIEMDGLRNIISSGRTLHGINSASAGNEFWDGKRIDAGAVVAGESLYERLADDVGAGGQGEVEAFLTTRGMRRRLADTYQSQKRFNDAKATEVHGGYTAIYVNEIPVMSDDDAPKGYAFGINKDAFKWFEVERPDWLQDPKTGTVFQLAAGSVAGSSRAAWQAWFVWYAALGCLAPNRNGAIFNATDDAS